MEYAMELWYEVVYNSPVYTKDLSSLLPHWIHHSKTSVEYLEISMKICEAYILLGGNHLMKASGLQIVEALGTMLNTVNENGLLVAMKYLDTIACLYHSQFPNSFSPLIKQMVENLLKSYQYRLQKRKGGVCSRFDLNCKLLDWQGP